MAEVIIMAWLVGGGADVEMTPGTDVSVLVGMGVGVEVGVTVLTLATGVGVSADVRREPAAINRMPPRITSPTKTTPPTMKIGRSDDPDPDGGRGGGGGGAGG